MAEEDVVQRHAVWAEQRRSSSRSLATLSSLSSSFFYGPQRLEAAAGNDDVFVYCYAGPEVCYWTAMKPMCCVRCLLVLFTAESVAVCVGLCCSKLSVLQSV
uniref:Uncharacterized protein n=1 Tax=Syphacia muris TaxID=451379 RepID=A0A0N5APX2_9BILA